MRQRRRALTLVEVLVVLAIIAVITMIVLPVLHRSKQRAADADTLARLRQLAVAQSLYIEQDGVPAMGTIDLVRAGIVLPSLCGLVTDPSRVGIANEFVLRPHPELPPNPALEVPFKNSFLGLREYLYTGEFFNRFIRDRPAAGWLIDVSPAQRKDLVGDPGFWSGRYRRLLFDGSVVTRQIGKVRIHNHDVETPISFFIDIDDQWITEHQDLFHPP